jgi:DNA (cytosine-5)-methyltransferase 1
MIKILELFGGIGACSSALTRLGIEYEITDYVEIDKYAVKSFNAIHNTNFEPQDICKWDKNIEVDLIMHGSPCQDFSLAGKQAGGDKDSGTRSSLMYETIRIVEKLKPKYVIWENVKNLLSKKHRHNFDAYLETMKQLGYTNYYQVLNAKDYGIPQNRERVFTVSILGDVKYDFPKGNKYDNKIDVIGNYMPSGHNASRIVNENGLAPTVKENHGTVTAVAINFEFPPKQPLKLKLKDMLEDNVDEKYYLSDKMANFFIYNEQKQIEKGNGFRFNVTDGNVIAKTITTRAGGRMDDNFIGDKKLYIKNATKKGYLEAYEVNYVNLAYPDSKTRRGRVGKQVAQTLTTSDNIGVVANDLRIRKLTPKECWRLMGFDDEDFEKANKVNSNTQLYKQSGNSIVVNVLMAILKELIK